MEIRIRKTNGKDEVFKSLTALLDEHLNRLNGKELQQERYAKYNTTDSIENAFVLYADDKVAACGAFKEYQEHISELKKNPCQRRIPSFRSGFFTDWLYRKKSSQAGISNDDPGISSDFKRCSSALL